MQIRFAAQRPAGDHALVIPIAGAARTSLDSLGTGKAGIEAAIKRQRFEGDAGSTADHYLDSDGGRRLVLVGIGTDTLTGESAERLGGSAVARLLTSGESEAVIDLGGTDFDADQSARVALGAALRSWRHDRYRTRLKDKQKPTLRTIIIVGAPEGAEARWTERYAPLAEGVALTRELVAEPANIIYPESFVERVRHLADLGIEIRVLGEAEMANAPALVKLLELNDGLLTAGKGKFLVNAKTKVLWLSAVSENRGVTAKVLRDHIEETAASVSDHRDAWDFTKWGKAADVKTEAKK